MSSAPASASATSPALRVWALLSLVIGIVCFIPAALICFAYYAHAWRERSSGLGGDWFYFALLVLLSSPISGSLVGGPLLIISGAARLLRSSVRVRYLDRVLLGGVLSSAWALLYALAAELDAPFHIGAWLWACAAILATSTAWWWRQRLRGEDLSPSVAGRPTSA
jgi:hypothetical protein